MSSSLGKKLVACKFEGQFFQESHLIFGKRSSKSPERFSHFISRNRIFGTFLNSSDVKEIPLKSTQIISTVSVPYNNEKKFPNNPGKVQNKLEKERSKQIYAMKMLQGVARSFTFFLVIMSNASS